jgi:hypothetical protein
MPGAPHLLCYLATCSRPNNRKAPFDEVKLILVCLCEAFCSEDFAVTAAPPAHPLDAAHSSVSVRVIGSQRRRSKSWFSHTTSFSGSERQTRRNWQPP